MATHPNSTALLGRPFGIAAALVAICGSLVPTVSSLGDDTTRRNLVRPSGGGGGNSGGGNGGGNAQPSRPAQPAPQPPPPPRREAPPPPPAQTASQAPSQDAPPPRQQADPGEGGQGLIRAAASGNIEPGGGDRTRRFLMRPGQFDRAALSGIPIPSGLDTARAAERDTTFRRLIVRSSGDWSGDTRRGDWSDNRRDIGRAWIPRVDHHRRNPRVQYSSQDQYYLYRDVLNYSAAPVYRYVQPQLSPLYSDLSAWNQWSWGVWDGKSASWGANTYSADYLRSPWRYSSPYDDDSSYESSVQPWEREYWRWADRFEHSSFETPRQFADSGAYAPSVGGTIILGYVSEVGNDAVPPPSAQGGAVGDVADPLNAKVNTAFDVVPLFSQAVNGANRGDFSASIYSMRRAAGVNPAGLFGSQSRIARIVADDSGWAKEVRQARAVFENPPERVVSEADAAFMVAALSAALGEPVRAKTSIAQARQVGDLHSSTELLRRALDGEDFSSASPWTAGRKLR